LRAKSSVPGQIRQRRSRSRPAPAADAVPSAATQATASAGRSIAAWQDGQASVRAASTRSWVTVASQAGQA
jgi:hypothetical protein